MLLAEHRRVARTRTCLLPAGRLRQAFSTWKHHAATRGTCVRAQAWVCCLLVAGRLPPLEQAVAHPLQLQPRQQRQGHEVHLRRRTTAEW